MNEELVNLLLSPNLIRNLCILAHVDHGKTTLADALIASNGIINQRQAGKIKYMDCRKDEIERGITMKSSCVTLTHQYKEEKYVVNLIDSPGHVDFSSEVSTAVRLCDGTIVVVDVVEGVCAQTKVVLKQAWLENIRPVLVLNKIDRLILEIKMSPLDAYYHIAQVLEQVNAYMGELHNTEVLGRMSGKPNDRASFSQGRRASETNMTEVADIFALWGIDDVDDTDLYFSPNHGNVVFASAYDGWGFSIHHFAQQYAKKLGMREEILNKTLWGDYYITSKNGKKRIVKGARDKRKPTLFVSLILENLYQVYNVIMDRKDKDELTKLTECLNIKMPLNIIKSSDNRYKVNFLCSRWLPLASAILDMVVEHLPAASAMEEERAKKLMCSATSSFSALPSPTQKLLEHYTNCSSSDEAPLIVYISKMFAVEKENLVKCKKTKIGNRITGMLTDEEIAAKRENIRARREAANAESLDGVPIKTEESTSEIKTTEPTEQTNEIIQEEENDSEVFVAFARVFSGTLRHGQSVYVLGPKHDPSKIIGCLDSNEDHFESEYIQQCQIDEIYMMLGRELEQIGCAPAGSVVGITGLQDCVIKSATLSSTVACPPFTELTHNSTPILRVAVEPQDPREFNKLRHGLKLLNQADPCVQVLLQDSGEYVLITAGEVHLERCIDDLQDRYAKIKVHVSSPIVPFRETIILPPTVDKMNEAIQGENINTKLDESKNPLGYVEVNSKAGVLGIRAVPLPPDVVKLLNENSTLLKYICDTSNSNNNKSDNYNKHNIEKDNITELNPDRQLIAAVKKFKSELNKLFNDSGPEWENAIDEIWSFGPHYSGPNILLNRVKEYDRGSLWDQQTKPKSPLYAYDSNFIMGFQLSSAAGPLCEEPMIGVCFIVEKWELPEDTCNLSGPLISSVKDTLRKAFEMQHQRIVWAMYSCTINVTSEVVGKMYTVIGRRQGRIIDGDILEGSTSWNITAFLPVVESFNFANELRKSTSGEAMPQLIFSHWETLDIDPFWEPQTTEELAHWGEKSDCGNIARKYINDVRKRKGLFVEDKIVEFAEKQRTLTRNK